MTTATTNKIFNVCILKQLPFVHLDPLDSSGSIKNTYLKRSQENASTNKCDRISAALVDLFLFSFT